MEPFLYPSHKRYILRVGMFLQENDLGRILNFMHEVLPCSSANIHAYSAFGRVDQKARARSCNVTMATPDTRD